ncbi:GPW/gp25 family protein [Rhizobium laguerreae]|uniref:GPW/gp25 family protein n=1 Tax=Rhizobium laguerreae TaxID=1076926 RepID=UPI001C92A515|nr:GPW/gp25 family protein [Rhizobium laguerreae]MBY3434822.1 baseplate assembly protein [Rhizobium laguerreae]MBY3448965.1 baseplate assembly protein [Rhizobium laguerreae]MBY3456739.1 baseplate assembly protein [Rhizobium laguerreae]
MADSAGINAVTGQPLSNWEHTQQSVGKIMQTAIGSRIMRRDFGSDIPDLIDTKMIRKNILAVYSAAATAIERWEPRFRMRSASVDEVSPDGRFGLIIQGTYFPRGHLGDYTIAEDRTARIALTI